MMGAEGTMVVDGGAGGGGQITKKRKNGDRGIELGTQVSLEHAASAIRDLTIQAESTTTATISIKMGWMEAATKGKERQKVIEKVRSLLKTLQKTNRATVQGSIWSLVEVEGEMTKISAPYLHLGLKGVTLKSEIGAKLPHVVDSWPICCNVTPFL
jgi:hypothetical protein